MRRVGGCTYYHSDQSRISISKPTVVSCTLVWLASDLQPLATSPVNISLIFALARFNRIPQAQKECTTLRGDRTVTESLDHTEAPAGEVPYSLQVNLMSTMRPPTCAATFSSACVSGGCQRDCMEANSPA